MKSFKLSSTKEVILMVTNFQEHMEYLTKLVIT